MSTRVYIQAKKDILVQEYKIIEEGQVGFMTSSKNEVTVRFPGFCGTMENIEEKFEVLPEYELDKAIEIIKSYEGHHTGNSYSRGCGEFQFNIKFYHWNTSPLAEELLSESERVDAHHEILENELRCLIDKQYCDGVLQDDFEWITNAYQEGRSGGWLVLGNVSAKDSESFETDRDEYLDSLSSVKKELLILAPRLTELTDNNEIVEVLAEIQEYGEELANIHGDLHDLKVEVNLLARDLEFIDTIIKRGKEKLAEYMKTEDCWSMFYEHIQHEQRQMVAARRAWNTLKLIAPGSTELERIMHDLKQVLPSEVYEAEFITYED